MSDAKVAGSNVAPRSDDVHYSLISPNRRNVEPSIRWFDACAWMSNLAQNWPREVDVDELANQLRLARGDSVWPAVADRPDDADGTGAVFLIGAGCSWSAGVPLAAQIAKNCAPLLANRLSDGKVRKATSESALKWLKANKHISDRDGATWADYYSEIFARHFRSDPQQRRIIQENVAKAKGINWAHICLGELVDQHFVHTVLTTNFDRLVLEGIVLTGRVPIIADGVEALTRISPRPTTPQVVHLHGSVHAYSPLNSPEAMVGAGRTLPMQGTMYGVLRDTDFLVVVGYAGGEDGVMALLSEAIKVLPNLGIYWVFLENSFDTIRQPVKDILQGPNKFYLLGQDADVFFASLTRALGVQPSWMTSPLSPLQARLKAVQYDKSNPDIALAVAGYGRALASFADTVRVPHSDEATIERAAGLSLAGRDDEVLMLISKAAAAKHASARRLRAISLQRVGDSQGSAKVLADAARLWEDYLREVPTDGEGFWRLGQTQASLAEKAKKSARWDRAIAAYQAAIKLLKRRQKGWIECRSDLAGAVVEAGAKGGDEKAISSAIAGLEDLRRTGQFGTESLSGARVHDLRGTLLLMRANLRKRREAFEMAIAASQEAVAGVWSSRSTSEAIGAHHHLAQAYRDFGLWLRASGQRTEAVTLLTEAATLFQQVEADYLRGADDAALESLAEPAEAARDERLAVGRLISQITAEAEV